MKNHVTALLLYNQAGPFRDLSLALRRRSVLVSEARSCGEAERVILGPEPPELVFTEPQLPDGSWSDVVRNARAANSPVNVIVVSPDVNIAFYLEVIQNGAFDFIAPPFEAPGLTHVVNCARDNVLARRQAQLSSPLLEREARV